MLALNPSAIARPAGSCEPLLMREPDDIRNSVLCRFDPVIASWFCAARDGILFRMLNAIRFSFLFGPVFPGTFSPGFVCGGSVPSVSLRNRSAFVHTHRHPPAG